MTDLLHEHLDRPPGPPMAAPLPVTPAMPAGKALGVMTLALLFAALFNSSAFVTAAHGMPYGWQRTALLGVARPFDSVARTLRLHRPRAALDRALGRDVPGQAQQGAFGEPIAGVSAGPSLVPSPAASASASPAPSPSASPAAPARAVTAADPLRLVVLGDSMIEFMAPKLITAAGDHVTGRTDVKYGTGLVRDDVFDWPEHARKLMAERDPEVVVVQMGGNDGQNIALGSGVILTAGTPEWAAEYERRAAVLMRVLNPDGARRVYWIGMPPAKSARLFTAYQVLNGALARAAGAVPGVTYVDIWDEFAPEGRYTDFLPIGGRPVLVRARDGIHVTRDGADLIARKLHAVLAADWNLR